MKKKKIRQVNSKSLVNIQDLKQRNQKKSMRFSLLYFQEHLSKLLYL